MDVLMQIVAWATANGPQLVTSINALLGALIVICLLIPGDQPEGYLQSVVNFLAKFSKK